MRRKIKYGMVGGGRGAFIGAVHRMAAALDGHMELVCGAFSGTPEKSKASGEDLYLPSDRCYADYGEMFRTEAALPEGERMDVVAIVTPNHLHFDPAMQALEAGFHVICDKPLCLTLSEARQLEKKVRESGSLFALTHNYTGYPMVKQARRMIADGLLGNIRRVVVEYSQGWLSTRLEVGHHKQAAWRTDPGLAGAAGAMGDIGTHAENLISYVTGLKISRLCADLHTHVEGRRLDDDGSVLLHFSNGARGILCASQISSGEENNLSIRVYGETGGIAWEQMEPNTLTVMWRDKPAEIYRTGGDHLFPEAKQHTRLPAGHPEGYIEAFANIYRNVAFTIQARLEAKDVDPVFMDFPGIEDGVRGMEFIDAVVRSGGNWVSLKENFHKI